MNLTNEQISKAIEEIIPYETDLGIIWQFAEDFSDTFSGRTEVFFILFKELLARGHLKLQRDQQIIEHTPEEWEAIFRKAWPTEEEDDEADNILMTYWFTCDDCPAYAVWVDPEDGHLIWST